MAEMRGHNDWPRVVKQLEVLNHAKVRVGFFGDGDSGETLLTIVRANEYGAEISPKKGKFLTIPTSAVPRGVKSPKEISGLFRPKNADGSLQKRLVKRVKKGKKYELVTYYYLVTHVSIPPRPFIRNAWNANKYNYKRIIINGVKGIIYNGMTAKSVLEQLGATAAADIQRSSIALRKPVNAKATTARKKSTNPLVDTGELQRMVTYKVDLG